jgi:phage tail sheath protein FI
MPDTRTPGVYINEVKPFSDAVEDLPTSIPVFIGHTEKAKDGSKELLNKPIAVYSLAEYIVYFGGAPLYKFTVNTVGDNTPSSNTLNGDNYVVNIEPNSNYYLYRSVQLFFENGGSRCDIISVGDYETPVSAERLKKGIDILAKHSEPSILVVPDAIALEAAACYDVQKYMLAHCNVQQNKIAILDIHKGDTRELSDLATIPNVITDFKTGIGTENLNYGAAYYPWLNTSIVKDGEVTFLNFDYTASYRDEANAAAITEILEEYYRRIHEPKLTGVQKKGILEYAHTRLLSVSMVYESLMNAGMELLNILPPSAAVAGICAITDVQGGVWSAPAGINNGRLNNVQEPTVQIPDSQVGELYVDNETGKGINCIRKIANVGTVVWGSKTLDGNSPDWKYLHVRRFIISVEQAIKNFLQSYAFAPNNAETWMKINAKVSDYLTKLWQRGALAGTETLQAFDVQIGLGTTMTAEDLLNGILRLCVQVALQHPAEFIMLTFQQQMQA